VEKGVVLDPEAIPVKMEEITAGVLAAGLALPVAELVDPELLLLRSFIDYESSYIYY
jgi:hypothetical protein